MPKIDLTSHASAIGILLALDIVFLVGLLCSYKLSVPSDVSLLIRDAFLGANGALLLCLRASNQNPPSAGAQ